MAASVGARGSPSSTPSVLARTGRGVGCQDAENQWEGWACRCGSGWGQRGGPEEGYNILNQNSRVLFNITLLSSTVKQPEVSAQKTICPYLGDLHQVTGEDPVFYLWPYWTHAMWPRSPPAQAESHQPVPVPFLSATPHVDCGVPSLSNQTPQGQAAHLCILPVPRKDWHSRASPAKPGSAKPCLQALLTHSAHCRLASPSPSLGDKTGWTLGCRGVG